MCKDHGKVFGKKAVQLFAEARILNNVCDARYQYLMRQAKSFHDWLGTQSCDDPSAVCKAIVAQIERDLRSTGPCALTSTPDDELNPTLFDTMAGLDDMDARIGADDSGWLDYQQELERIANKSMRTMEAKLSWYTARMYPLQQMLSLHDRIQDMLDLVPNVCDVPVEQKKRIKNKLNKYSVRLMTLRKEHKLYWYDWAMFQNQVNTKLGYKTITPKYVPTYLVADKVAYWEAKIDDARKAREEELLTNIEPELPPESYVALFDEIESL